MVLDATDNCGGNVTVEFSEYFTEGDCESSGVWTRVWTATDCTGNSTEHTQHIALEDSTPPVFTDVPSDQNEQCSELPYTATATDHCSDVTLSEERTIVSQDGCGNYVHQVNLTATDACGNAAFAQFTITVNDTEGPEFLEPLPADVTASCDAIPEAPVLTATDACGDVEVLFEELFVPTTCPSNGVLTRIWTVTDCSSNSTQHIQLITVEDTTAPDVIAEVNMSLAVEAFDSEAAYGEAIDACSEVELVYSDELTEMGCAGTIMRTYVATDACGNESQPFVQMIELLDTIAPSVISVPENSTYGCNEAIVLEYPEASDNHDVALDISFSDQVVDEDETDQSYQVIRTFTITDDCGNTATATTQIFVTDEVAPSLVFLPEIPTLEPEVWDSSLIAAYQPRRSRCMQSCHRRRRFGNGRFARNWNARNMEFRGTSRRLHWFVPSRC